MPRSPVKLVRGIKAISTKAESPTEKSLLKETNPLPTADARLDSIFELRAILQNVPLVRKVTVKIKLTN